MYIQAQFKSLKESNYPVIYPVYQDIALADELKELLDYDLNADLAKENGQLSKIHTFGRLPFNYIYFLGLGNSSEISISKMKAAFVQVAKAISELKVVVDLRPAVTAQFSINELVSLFIEASSTTLYQYPKAKQNAKVQPTFEFLSMTDLSATIKRAVALNQAINMTRTLSNQPGNLLTPLTLAEYALNLANKYNLAIEVFNNRQLAEIGAGGILAVNQGSQYEARLIVIKYQGIPNEPFTALIGKGITFDTGGYNLKSAQSMTKMKGDMSGAATVLGALAYIAEVKLPVNIYVIIPTTENMISGAGYKCDDVITMLDGKTVEVTNTDAEGRIVLADALAYTAKLPVDKIIDVATLTGACFIALGDQVTGVFANDEKLYNKIAAAANQADELIWRLPLYPNYAQILKHSLVADLVNSVPGAGGGASIAACFLQEFVPAKSAWLHLDIAGTIVNNDKNAINPQGATGVMVKTLVNYFQP